MRLSVSLAGRSLPFVLGFFLLVFAACDSDGSDDQSDQSVFAVYDTNSNGEISVNEFGSVITRNFPINDFDDDNSVGSSGENLYSEEEFSEVARFYGFGARDDDNSTIDQEEFEAGLEFYFDEPIEQDFSDFDADGNGEIEAEEFSTAFSETGAFDTFDADDSDSISLVELVEGLFDLFDGNANGALDETEFNDGIQAFFGVDPTEQQQTATGPSGAPMISR